MCLGTEIVGAGMGMEGRETEMERGGEGYVLGIDTLLEAVRVKGGGP